jgi:hypothetical protein
MGDKMYEICDLVAGLPESGAMTLVSNRGNRDDWTRVAKRGFFAYDWSHERDCYEPISVPASPLCLAKLALQSPIRQAAELSRLNVHFAAVGDIQLL